MAGPGRGRVRGRRLTIEPNKAFAVLADAPQIYVGIRTSTGPHVTPELFTISGDRIVCLTAASTLKAKVARRQPMIAVAARSSSGQTLSALGTAEIFDPLNPSSAISAPRTMTTSPLDTARFVRDNAAELAGAARDAARGLLGVPPEHRVVLSIRIGEATVEDRESDVVVGWTRDDGTVLAFPALEADDDGATISAHLFDAMNGAASSRACITSDDWTGPGPTGKQGVMRRGTGIARRNGGIIAISLSVERTVEWDGVDVWSTSSDEG